MFRQIVAFLAVLAVAFATTCGPCYTGYGRYETFGTGLCGAGLLTGVPVISSGVYTNPIVNSGVYTAVGAPEVISSCENSYNVPFVGGGLVSTGFGGCGARVLAAVC